MRCTAAAACLIALAAAGQNPPQPPVFRSEITLVEVEVSVLDRTRRPVLGLTAADFTILEDGAPQEIRTFAMIELPPPPATPWMREVAPDVRDNTPREGRLVAIVLDDAQITLRMLEPAKQMARRLIAELSPGDLAAVIFTRVNSRAQEFTEDKARLLAAVDHLYSGVVGAPTRPPPLPPGPGVAVYRPTVDTGDTSVGLTQDQSVSVLGNVVASLGEVPKRRKAIFYVGSGVPIDLAARSARGNELLGRMSEVIEEARRWNVTIYPFDPSLRNLASVLPTPRREFLQTVAEKSGGFVTGDGDDQAARVAQVFRETSTYYLIGYQSPRTEADGKFRPIEVKLARSDVSVHARGGYRAPRPATASSSKARGSEVGLAETQALPKSDIRMQALAAPFAGVGRAGPTVAVIVGIRHPASGDGARVRENLQLQLSAYAAQGKLRGSRRLSYGFGLVAGGSEVAYELASQLDLPPGSYQLRISASSEALGKSGSVYHDVVVPDFSKRALSLSGLLLAADPAPLAVGADRLAALLPLVPTSMREFKRETRVTAFARVYQRAKAPADVAAVLTLLDGSGKRLFRASESLDASRFAAAGAVDYQCELPIANLEPGPYLLSVEVKRGELTENRSVRFAVVR